MCASENLNSRSMIMPTASEQPPRRLHHHHHAHHLDFELVRKVPDSHDWPDLHDHPTASPPEPAVPVVDLSAADLLDQLSRACCSWGAFQLTGHGVPLGLLRRVEAAARRLFALPTSRKLEAARPADGVSGYGSARISCFFPKLMWSEGFTIDGSSLEHARKLWPDDPFPFCDAMEEYKSHMKQLTRRLMRLMLMSLGVNEEEMDWADPTAETVEMAAVLHLNSYPACPNPDRAMGLAAHTDSTLLTLLYQSDTSGLQVLQDRDRPARWVTVPPLPGALVVNVGDLFQILSNGRYVSIVHRAIVSQTSHRVSVAYMCGTPGDVKVSPIGKLVGPGHGPAYRAVTWPEYLRVKGKLFDKALAYVMCQEDSPEQHL